MDTHSSVTVVVTTADRGAGIVPTIESLLANDHPDFKIIVVDQSRTDETEQAVVPFLANERVAYIRTPTRGKGIANNIGLQHSETEIVLLTDDDCTVPKDWMRIMQDTFKIDPKIAVVFCNVNQGDHDPKAGFIPAYYRKDSQLITTLAQKCRANGIGAGMAVRREAVQSIGNFDEMLGVGGAFGSGSETDLGNRALLLGYYLYETNATSVLHFGFRTFEQGQAMAKRKWYGTGTSIAKPLKCGYWSFWIIPANMLLAFAIAPMINDIFHLRKPRGAKKIPAFIRGLIHGWRTPVNRKTLLFISPATP